jgi:hypothetical protein
MSAPQNGKTIWAQTEETAPVYTANIPISELQTDGTYKSFKCTQQNLTKLREVSITTNYVILPGVDLVIADSTGGILTVTLPTAVGISGVIKIIKKINAGNNITISCNGSETIDGSSTHTISTQWDSLKVISNGTNWLVCP